MGDEIGLIGDEQIAETMKKKTETKAIFAWKNKKNNDIDDDDAEIETIGDEEVVEATKKKSKAKAIFVWKNNKNDVAEPEENVKAIKQKREKKINSFFKLK